jgi:hypothetical protein
VSASLLDVNDLPVIVLMRSATQIFPCRWMHVPSPLSGNTAKNHVHALFLAMKEELLVDGTVNGQSFNLRSRRCSFKKAESQVRRLRRELLSTTFVYGDVFVLLFV